MSDVAARLNEALEGHYRLERELGRGGMATVYLADDLRSGRKVAFKVLKPELAAVVGADRFLAEIKTTANLQHPHILPLFDSGEVDGLPYYVMPYVAGDSLRARLDRDHQLPIDEAVRIATKMAEALDYAHRQGVIHRDIKPANVLTLDGEPVISDFGIALAVGLAGAGRLTETGMSLGTPHYMSPEQATGDQHVGPATDVWALGCVLYEMLVGEPPYTGSTPQAILGRIITGATPSASEERSSVPPNVDAAIRKALEKVPADRFTTAGDFAGALSDPGFRHGLWGTGAAGPPSSRSRWRATLPWGLAAGFAVLALVLVSRPPSAQRLGVVRVTIPVRDELSHSFPRRETTGLAFSPDGEFLVYRTADVDQEIRAAALDDRGTRLYMRRLDQDASVPIAEDAWLPFFSPEGDWLGFVEGRVLKRMSMADRHVETIAALPSLVDRPGITWADDGTIVVNGQQALYRIPASGGEWETLLEATPGPGGFERFGQPYMLPGSDVLLLHIQRSLDPADADIVALDLHTQAQKTVLTNAMAPLYVRTGHLLFAREGTLLAVRFDAERLEAVGQPVVLVEGVMHTVYWHNGSNETGAAQVAVSNAGHLVYALGGVYPELPVAPVRITVDADTLPLDLEIRGYIGFRVSPDGTRLVAVSRHGMRNELLIHDFRRGTTDRLNTGAFHNWPVEWSPDGRFVIYSSDRDQPVANLYRLPADGGGEPERLAASELEQSVTSISPDGDIVFQALDPQLGEGDIWVLPRGGSPTPLVTSEGSNEAFGVLTPGGDWLAYTSNRSGTSEVFVKPYPGSASGTLITHGGGSGLAWSPNGQRLYYVKDDELWAVDLILGDEIQVGDPQWIMGCCGFWNIEPRGYDVLSDGSIIKGIYRVSAWPGETQLHVILNFFELLKERLPN